MSARRLVLGLDPGSRVTGYGVVEEISGRLGLVDAGVIRTTAEDDLSRKLGFIFTNVKELVVTYKPDEIAVENVFMARNADSALKLGQARGAALSACAVMNVPVFSYEPTMVKKSLTGVGRAEKTQVAFMVARLLGVKNDWPKDASDALALAICHLNSRRINYLNSVVGK